MAAFTNRTNPNKNKHFQSIQVVRKIFSEGMECVILNCYGSLNAFPLFLPKLCHLVGEDWIIKKSHLCTRNYGREVFFSRREIHLRRFSFTRIVLLVY